MRNWPYAYALGKKDPKVKGKFAVAPLPAFEGAGKAGILGGHNSVISVYSKNPGGALTLIDYMTSARDRRRATRRSSRWRRCSTAAYDDAGRQEGAAVRRELKQAVEQAKTRPVSPVYPQISQAIYKNVNAALSGQQSPQDAMKNATADIKKALSTF